MAFRADRERQDAAQDQERVERPEGRAGLDLDPVDLGHGRCGSGDDTGDDIAVAAEELGRRLHDEVRAEVQRPADVRACERVVDHVRRPMPVGELRETGVIGDDGRGVRDRLGVQHGRRSRIEGGLDRVEVRDVHEVHLDPEPAERVEQQRARGAVQVARRDDPIARPDARGEGGVDRAHPRRESGSEFAAGQLGVGGPEGGRGRVADPAVGIAAAWIPEDVPERLGIGRGERGRLEDRDAGRHLVELAARATRP